MMAETSSLSEQLISKGLAADQANTICKILDSNAPASQKWHEICENVLTPEIPFNIHQFLFSTVYDASHNFENEPNYVWIPTKEAIEATNLHKLIKSTNHNNLKEFFDWSDANREEFWQLMTKTLNIQFDKKPAQFKIFDFLTNKEGIANPIYYPQCQMNAVDTLLQGNDNKIAIVYAHESQYSEELKNNKIPELHEISLKRLKMEVNAIADGLRNKLNLNIGDAVAIDMPMNWESVAIYLGIIKAGLVVVSIADSFAPHAIEVRLKIANTKAIFTQDIIPRGGKKIPLYQRVLQVDNPPIIIVLPADFKTHKLDIELRQGDMSYQYFMKNNNNNAFKSESMDSMALANILFSSGTTGEPKAIPWHHSTFVKPLSDGYLHNDVQSGEVVAWPTNLGWMMGPWLIAQMGLGSTIALFVGSPVSHAFCKFVEQSKIAHLGIIPSIVKAWMRQDATKNCNWKGVRRFSSTGEASNPVLYHWVVSRAYYAPVLEYVGGTEIAGGYMGGTMIQPQLLSSFSCVCFGMNIFVMDRETGKESSTTEGELCISPPSIGLSVTLLNKDHFTEYYGDMPLSPDESKSADLRLLRRHGDQIKILSNGYYQHLGRCDDTMNLGGIKISSIELENAVIKHPLLSRECAAIAYRGQAVDTESLIICAVPKNPNDTFMVSFEKRPLGLTLAPAKTTDSRTLVSDVTPNDEKSNDKNDINNQFPNLKGSVLYKVNSHIVYDKKFDDVIKMVENEQLPLKLQFVRQGFDITKLKQELRNLVKIDLNPLFRVEDVYVVNQLPRTASGKVMRRVLRADYANAANF